MRSSDLKKKLGENSLFKKKKRKKGLKQHMVKRTFWKILKESPHFKGIFF
jgi:hypothetical protein